MNNKHYTEWTIEEFRKLPRNDNWSNKNIGNVMSIIVLPCENFHDSGYRIMDLVLVDENDEPKCIVGDCYDFLVFKNMLDYIKIDCLPTSGLLRLWGKTSMHIGSSLSAINIKFLENHNNHI